MWTANQALEEESWWCKTLSLCLQKPHIVVECLLNTDEPGKIVTTFSVCLQEFLTIIRVINEKFTVYLHNKLLLMVKNRKEQTSGWLLTKRTPSCTFLDLARHEHR